MPAKSKTPVKKSNEKPIKKNVKAKANKSESKA